MFGSESKCENCLFFHGAQGMEGECRRYPAQMPVTQYGSWPPTVADGWCGEWKPRGNDDPRSGSVTVRHQSALP